MEISAKERLLADIFYNPQTGFRGVEQTYTAARLRDGTVNRGDVRAFLAKQEVRQRRKPHKVNSYVAAFPRQEFQVDLQCCATLWVCLHRYFHQKGCMHTYK